MRYNLNYMNFTNIENTFESTKELKSIEVSAEEIKLLKEVQKYWDKILDEGDEDYNGPLFGSNQEVNDLWKQKEAAEEQRISSLNESEKWQASWLLKQAAQYEVLKDQIDYKNEQLRKLIIYIEEQPIWKYKFTTSNDSRSKFANQDFDSIYYLTDSGVSLRLKKDLYLSKLRSMLQKPNDLSIFISQDCGINDTKRQSRQEEIPEKYVSLEPKVGYQVQEYYSDELRLQEEGNFKSKIKVVKSGDKIIISGFNGDHMGHFVDKIESL